MAIYRRKPGTGGGDPLLAGLNAQQKALVRRYASAIKANKDLEQLKMQLAGIEAQMEKAGAKAPPTMKIVRDIIRKRIGELEKK